MPTSNQMSAGTNKAAKFVAANPLGPMADPFSGMGDDEKELHKEVSENVQKRMDKAMEELKEKHRRGTNEVDDVDRAPTGAAYRELHQQQRKEAMTTMRAKEEREAMERMQQNRNLMEVKEQMRRMKFGSDIAENMENHSDDDSDDEFDHLLDEEDPELLQIRQKRLTELKQNQIQRVENQSLGHGELRTIKQDDFLPECTGKSLHVCVHFFSDDFERCKIMDFHLKIIAEQHLECKFLRIEAEKAPFFVTKLRIRALPALLVFDHGKEIGRLTGFDGLAIDPNKPDDWHTGKLQEWLSEKGAIKYRKPTEEVEEERKRLGLVVNGAVWSEREKSGIVEEF